MNASRFLRASRESVEYLFMPNSIDFDRESSWRCVDEKTDEAKKFKAGVGARGRRRNFNRSLKQITGRKIEGKRTQAFKLAKKNKTEAALFNSLFILDMPDLN